MGENNEEINVGVRFSDVLDMLLRPPIPGTRAAAMAYSEYLDCQTVSCDAWLWRRNLGKPDWGDQVLEMWKGMEEHLRKKWNPIHKCPAR